MSMEKRIKLKKYILTSDNGSGKLIGRIRMQICGYAAKRLKHVDKLTRKMVESMPTWQFKTWRSATNKASTLGV